MAVEIPVTGAPVVAPMNVTDRLAAIHAKVEAEHRGSPVAEPVSQPVTVSQPPNATSSTEDGLDLPIDPPVADKLAGEPEKGSTGSSVADAILEHAEEDKTPKKDLHENFKKLRTSHKQVKEELESQNNLVAELTRKIEQYESGEVLPESVQQLQERVKELEPLKELRDLRLSPEYEEKYAAPLENAVSKARQFAQDYEIDPSILDHARELTNKKERNKFLRGHLDEVGTLEAVSILDEITLKENEIVDAESQPAVSFEQLKQERANYAREQEETRVSRIKTSAKSAWTDALTELRSSGEYPEVTLTGDPKIDSRIKPIIEAASKEYGKMVTAFGKLKMADLPEDQAKILAKWALMAQSASLMALSRASHYREQQEVLATTRRHNPMYRPQIGQSNGLGGYVNGADNGSPKIGHQNAAATLRSNVLSK